MPQIGANFQFTSRQPNFERDQFDTIAHMAECTICDEGHICYCLETHKTYRFRTKDDNGNTKTYDNSEGGLGYWEEFQPGGGGGEGTITGATIGSGSSAQQVPESGGVLKFPAYPTVPITGIKDANGNDLTPVNGKVTLPAASAAPISKIKVDGASDDLPINDGRVVIPQPPVKGIKTNGGTDLTPNNGIVTLPSIPAAPTADTMQYSGSTNYSTGSIGKEVKDLNGSVNNLSTKVAELEKDKPSPTPSSSTTIVNLATYATSGSSFTYDVDNKYIYNTKDTTFYQYSEENNNTTVYYGVFKVIGEDRYLMYSITNNTTFTYANTYTELTLPANAKKEFALGSVAVVKRVNGEGESWQNGTVNLFCTKQNMPLRNRCRNINFNGSTAWRVLIKSEDSNTIFVYKAKSNGNYEWEINVPRSSTANFNLLDKYFDRPDASDVDFDNTNTGLNATNVNAAIGEVFTTLKYTSGTATVSSASFTLPSTVTGNTYYDITSTPITSLTIPSINSPYEIVIKFTTDSTNPCTIAIPNNQKYIGDLSVDKDVTYIISIFNGVIVIAETETKTNSQTE